MSKWTNQFEEDLALLIKDWLKAKGRTQADLQKSLKSSSTRMNALLEVLQKEHKIGGLERMIRRLCLIESEWENPEVTSSLKDQSANPFGQLDFLLKELREDCSNAP